MGGVRPRPETTACARALAVVAFLGAAVGLPGTAWGDVPQPEPARTMRLRVLTYNVFGIPNLSPAIDERMAAIGPAMVALAPDVILLQEMWRNEDADRITDALQRAGFVAVRSFASEHWTDPGRSGLVIATKLAIVGERFEAFEAGTLPHIPWHVDWRGGKGSFAVRLATPVGEIGVVNVHAQASYATGHYEGIRVAQAIETAAGIAAPGGVVGADDPLVLGGDVNAPPDQPSTRLLEALTGTRIEDRTLGTDVLMARSGTAIAVEVVETRRVLTEPLRLADGTVVPLSDHEGVLLDLVLRRCDGPGDAPCGNPPVDPAPGDAVAVARAAVEEDRSRTGWLRGATAIGAGGSALLAVRAGRTLPRRRRRRERALVAAFVLWSLFWAMWWTYTAFVFAPHHLGILDRARAALDAAPAGEPGWSPRHAPVTVERAQPR